MTCKHCSKPIVHCQPGPPTVPPCYYHPGNGGWHRCDGQSEDEATERGPLAEPR